MGKGKHIGVGRGRVGGGGGVVIISTSISTQIPNQNNTVNKLILAVIKD